MTHVTNGIVVVLPTEKRVRETKLMRAILMNRRAA